MRVCRGPPPLVYIGSMILPICLTKGTAMSNLCLYCQKNQAANKFCSITCCCRYNNKIKASKAKESHTHKCNYCNNMTTNPQFCSTKCFGMKSRHKTYYCKVCNIIISYTHTTIKYCKSCRQTTHNHNYKEDRKSVV